MRQNMTQNVFPLVYYNFTTNISAKVKCAGVQKIFYSGHAGQIETRAIDYTLIKKQLRIDLIHDRF